MNEIWPSIQIIFEQKKLVEKAKEAISTTNLELGYMPTTTNRIIKFLNSKNRYELEELGVAERTSETILQVKNLLTKNNLIVQLEDKCQNLELTVNRFFNRIESLTQKGLPSLFVINDKLVTREDYVKRLKYITKDVFNLSNIRGNITRKAMMEAISNPIYLEHELKHVFTIKPTFAKYTEVDEAYAGLPKSKSHMKMNGVICATTKRNSTSRTKGTVQS